MTSKLLLGLTAATLLLASCSAWHLTGETQVGDTSGFSNPGNMQNPPTGGTAGTRQPGIPSKNVLSKEESLKVGPTDTARKAR